MKSSEEFRKLFPGLEPYEEKITREEELEKLKQEILDRAKLETQDIIKQKTIETKKEIISYLKLDIADIENSIITKDEMKGKMIEFFDKFDKFLNEFSHIEGYIQDPNAKSKLHEAIKGVSDSIMAVISWLKGD